MPDKAVDLIDEAASKIRIDQQLHPMTLREKESKLRQLQIEEIASSEMGKYEKAAEIKAEIARIGENYTDERNQLNSLETSERQVTSEDIASLVATWTGIPVDRLLESEADKLLNMESSAFRCGEEARWIILHWREEARLMEAALSSWVWRLQ